MPCEDQTSDNNKLRIDEIAVGTSGGRIGITFAPGKHQPNALSGSHRRNLHADLDVVAAWGATAVVTLVEQHELETLRIENLGEEVRRRKMDWPIRDVTAPDRHFEAAWPARSERLRSLVLNGGRVLIHCKGGLGRAGTISAKLLVDMGVEPTLAMEKVRAAREGAIETKEQENWIARGWTPNHGAAPVRRRGQNQSLDWFEKLTGFKEGSYHETQKKFEVSDGEIRSLVNGRAYRAGTLELISLRTLRDRAAAAAGHGRGRSTFRNIVGDARELHQRDEFEGALFQVASQFNLLEMVGPEITPEQGVTGYQNDKTQGPACAIAAGAATIFRNYFVPIDGERGQTRSRQIDGLADLGAALSARLEMPVESLWTMRNGYALCGAAGLQAIGSHLDGLSEAERDNLRCLLRIGLHGDVEVTDDGREPPRIVSQAFCSALPVAYTNMSKPLWRPFAELVLEAAYEATLLAGALNAARGRSNIVLLTRLGGGAFGNHGTWIDAAIKRALAIAKDQNLDIRMVNYGFVPPAMRELESSLR
jgi:protein-tyrosine phosphatase